jgi:hypothetical protein
VNKSFPNGNIYALQYDGNDNITFGGSHDSMAFLFPYNDKITATGNHQTLGLYKAFGEVDVRDHGHGLTINLGTTFGHVDIHGLQNDLMARVSMPINTGQYLTTKLGSDHHGGTEVTNLQGGGSVDFVGAHMSIVKLDSWSMTLGVAHHG